MPRISIGLIKSQEYKGKTYRIWDSDLKGFGLVVQKDSMSFIIQYRNQYGKQKYMTLGRVGKITPDEARIMAKKKFGDIAHDKDPATQRAEDKNTITIGEMCDWYMRNNTNKRPSTLAHNNSAIERHIKPLIGSMPIKEVNRETIERFVSDIESGNKIQRKEKSDRPRGRIYVTGGKSAASHTLSFLGTIFEYAIKHEKLEKNPAKGIKRAQDNKKEIFLNIDEIRAFGRLLTNKKLIVTHGTSIDVIKLLLMTGCRRGEILTLKWDYIDWAAQCFVFPITKTTGRQIRPFGRGALELLKDLQARRAKGSPFVFPATRESKDGHLSGTGLYKALKTIISTRDDNGDLIFQKPDLDLHALRHTFASMGEHLEYGPITIGGLLGHKSGAVGITITGRYIHKTDKSLIAAADDISLTVKQALNPSARDDNAQSEEKATTPNPGTQDCSTNIIL